MHFGVFVIQKLSCHHFAWVSVFWVPWFFAAVLLFVHWHVVNQKSIHWLTFWLSEAFVCMACSCRNACIGHIERSHVWCLMIVCVSYFYSYCCGLDSETTCRCSYKQNTKKRPKTLVSLLHKNMLHLFNFSLLLSFFQA